MTSSRRGRRVAAAVGVVAAAALFAWWLWPVASSADGQASATLPGQTAVRRGVSSTGRREAAEAAAAPKSDPAVAPTNSTRTGNVVCGHVRTRDGRPVAGAVVTAYRRRGTIRRVLEFVENAVSMPTAERWTETRTDAAGAYSVTVDATDAYVVVARAEGFEIFQPGVPARDIRAGSVVDLEAVDFVELRRIAGDATAADAERVDAAMFLCRERSGLTPPVVEALLALARTSKDATARERVLNYVHVSCSIAGGPPHAALETALLAALHDDADESVRAEAATDLDLFRDDAAVRDALAKARDLDASATVRDAAAKTLKNGGR